MINKERSVEEFCRLVGIDSLSFHEEKMVAYLTKRLADMGIQPQTDSMGNIYAYVKGGKDEKPVLLCAHTDTVAPGLGKKAVIDGSGKITSDGTTVLGADDAAGIAAILELLEVLRENKLPHRDIELLFPAAEEVYIKGTNAFDFSKIRSKTGYVLDLDGDIGTAAVQAPSLISFEANITGRSAHAGFAPEAGINAIAAAAEAISHISQGRPDDISTLNIGTIQGGTATNIISESCIVKGELRSLSHQNALDLLRGVKTGFEQACKKHGADLVFTESTDLTAYKTELSSETVDIYKRACAAADIAPKFISTFGGSDNNNFAKNGIEGIVVSVGYHNAHTCGEYIYADDIAKVTKILLEIVR